MAPAEPNALPFQTKGQEPHFPEEIDGWKGYIEWEKYPEKKQEAEAILEKYDFPDVSSSHLAHFPSQPTWSELTSKLHSPLNSSLTMCRPRTPC